jgi:serine/threonine protein phosphatase PrpC
MKRVFACHDQSQPVCVAADRAEIVCFSAAGSDALDSNEDAAGVWEPRPGVLVIAVADGLGGGPHGAEAAGLAIDAIDRAVSVEPEGDRTLRGSIMDGFEQANSAILESWRGAGTTLVVVEIVDGVARSYHAGDSGALIVGQRGRVRMETLHHSPTGYGVAAGMLDRDDTHVHEERSLLSNCVGATDMRIEIGPPVELAARDTLLLATDGVLDNVHHDVLVDSIRRGPLVEAAGLIRDHARAAMCGEHPDLPAHPDDATAVLLRLRSTREDSRSRSES